jgi:hypothetical protein
VRVIGAGVGGPGSRDGQLKRPFGLRFSADGAAICVADWGNGRTSLFCVVDGGFKRHVAVGLRGPRDVEVVEGGWLVSCSASDTVELWGDVSVGYAVVLGDDPPSGWARLVVGAEMRTGSSGPPSPLRLWLMWGWLCEIGATNAFRYPAYGG